NRAAANGNVGAACVAKSAPDGTTLLLSDVGALAINPSVYVDMPFDPAKDFSPVVMVSYSPHVLAVHPSVPVASVKELIAYARANPGKLNFANSGTGGAPHLAGVEFEARTGVQWAYIPYKGARRRSHCEATASKRRGGILGAIDGLGKPAREGRAMGDIRPQTRLSRP